MPRRNTRDGVTGELRVRSVRQISFYVERAMKALSRGGVSSASSVMDAAAGSACGLMIPITASRPCGEPPDALVNFWRRHVAQGQAKLCRRGAAQQEK
jgi:hypothetical protein